MPAPARRRENQRNRTRAALLAAAGALMREGRRPSIPDVAAAAGIARRTAYRYFPSAEQLHTEAALETLRPAMEGALATMSGANPEARLERTVREMQRLAAQNEDLLRAMIRLTVDRRAAEQTTGHAPVRGSRRIDWLEASLAPIRSRLTPRAFARLISAVSLCVGAEAHRFARRAWSRRKARRRRFELGRDRAAAGKPRRTRREADEAALGREAVVVTGQGRNDASANHWDP